MYMCVGTCDWVCVYLSLSEARFTLIQVGLHLAHNLFVRQRHEGVGVIEVCRNHCAWLCLVLILLHIQQQSVQAACEEDPCEKDLYSTVLLHGADTAVCCQHIG